MGISKCSYCGRERSAPNVPDGKISHGVCPECSKKEFDTSAEDLEKDLLAEADEKYGEWHDPIGKEGTEGKHR